MAATVNVTLSDEEKEIILEALENGDALGLDAIVQKLEAPQKTIEFAPEEMEIILEAIDVYGDIFGDQEEPIVQKLTAVLETLGRTWSPI
jgi:hypothetical protein